MTFDEVLIKLKYFSELKDNWDSYHSVPINPIAIKTAYKVLYLLHGTYSNYHVFPVPGGGVQIELQRENVEMEILPDGSIDVLLVG